MWKLLAAFILFAAIAIWVIMQGGNSLDMGGEKHGDPHATEAAAPASMVSGVSQEVRVPASDPAMQPASEASQ